MLATALTTLFASAVRHRNESEWFRSARTHKRDKNPLHARWTHYMQRGGPLLARDLCCSIRPSTVHTPCRRIFGSTKKGIQFGLSIHSKLYCRKSQCFAVQFRDEYPPGRNRVQGL